MPARDRTRSTVLSDPQIGKLLTDAGFSPGDATNFVGIAHAESGGRYDALNDNPSTGDYSIGLWQENFYASLGPYRTARYAPRFGLKATMAPDQFAGWLRDHPVAQAEIAHDLFESSGYRPWTGDAYVSGNPGLLSEPAQHGNTRWTRGGGPAGQAGDGATPTPRGRGPRPSKGGQSIWDRIANGAVAGAEGVTGTSVIGGAWDWIFGGNNPVSDAASFFKFAAWLANPLTWLRAVEGTVGVLLMFAGIYFVGQAAKDTIARRVPGVSLAGEAVAGGLGAIGAARLARDTKRYRSRSYRTSRQGISKRDSVKTVKPKVDVSRPLRKTKAADEDIFGAPL